MEVNCLVFFDLTFLPEWLERFHHPLIVQRPNHENMLKYRGCMYVLFSTAMDGYGAKIQIRSESLMPIIIMLESTLFNLRKEII